MIAYETWDALGDPTRRAIFRSLVVRSQAVGELASAFPISRPAVSQHLKVLKSVGLVVDHADGARRVYAAHAPGIAALRAELDEFWGQALAAFKAEVEAPVRRKKPKEKKR